MPDLGDIGMELRSLFGARGMGEFMGLSRGLIGRPGLSNDGAVLLFGSADPCEPVGRFFTITADSSAG